MRTSSWAPLSLSALILGVGCGTPAETPADSGVEDVGVADTCTDSAPCPLVPGTMASEKITPVMDTDRFTFAVPAANQIINVVVSNDATFSPIRLEVVLFGPDGSSLANQRYQMSGKQRVEIQVVAPAAGNYAVVVRDVGNDGEDRSNPYFVNVTLISDADNNEPNNTRAEATTLSDGVAVTGNIGTQGDEDWFKIDMPANSLLQVEVSAPGAPTTVRFKWEIYDETGNTRVAESTEPATDLAWPIENRAVGNTAGTYFIRLFDDPSDGMQADTSRVYSLTVRIAPEVDVQDLAAPNEDKDTATLVAGAPITGYIASTSDADWYRIRITNAPQIIRVTASVATASEVDISFTLFAPNGRDLICADEDGDICRAFRVVQDGSSGPTSISTAHVARTNGNYFVKVSDFQDNDFSTTTPYTVLIDTPNDPDTNENLGPKDRSAAVFFAPTSSTAAMIQWPWITGYLSYVNDEDWYAVQVPGPGPINNGDWMVVLEMQVTGPTQVEVQNWLYADTSAPFSQYGAKGYECREPTAQDPFPCQYTEAQNTIDRKYGQCPDANCNNECFTMFREQTGAGLHYFRINDLDRDDYDLNPSGQYRFRLTVTPNCVTPGVCEGRFRANICSGSTGAFPDDCCGRP